MDRRRFLLSAAGVVSAAVTPTVSHAHSEQCVSAYHPQFVQVAPCVVGLRPGPLPRQECQNWCWAACSESIFGLAGFQVDQTRFVEKVYGNASRCEPANGPMIKNGIDGRWVDERGRRFWANLQIVMDTFYGIGHPQPLAVVWNELNQGRALMTGALGHAVLITAMEYIRTPAGPETTAVIVRDPWPGSPNRRLMTPQEFFNVSFLATLRLS